MNDRYYYESILNNLKSLANLLHNATIEASTPDVRSTFNALLFDTLEMQNATYQTMAQKGWYKETKAPITSIKEATQSATMMN